MLQNFAFARTRNLTPSLLLFITVFSIRMRFSAA